MPENNPLFAEYEKLIEDSDKNNPLNAQRDALTAEYESFVSGIEDYKRIRAKSLIQGTRESNPDQAARALDLAEQSKLPQDTVERNLPEVEQQVRLNEQNRLIDSSPVLQSWLNNEVNAKVSSDDLENLQAVEKETQDLFGLKRVLASQVHIGFGLLAQGIRDVEQPDQFLSSRAQTAKTGAASVTQATLGMSQMLFRTPDAVARNWNALVQAGRDLGLPTWAMPKTEDLWVPDVINIRHHSNVVANEIARAQQILTENFEPFKRLAELNENGDKALEAAINGDPTALIGIVTDPESWVAFIGNALPSLFAAYKSGGSSAFIAWMEGMDYATSAADFERRTAQKIDDVEFAKGQLMVMGFNTWLEKLGLDKVMNSKNFLGAVAAAGTEGATETLQEFTQNLAEKLTYNPEASLTQGLLPAFMGGAGSGGGMATARIYANRVQAEQDLQDAQQRIDKFKKLQEKILASKTFERHKGKFQEFVDTTLAENEDKHIFIDAKNAANTLMQSGVDPKDVFTEIGVNEDALKDALETGGDVKVKLSDFVKIADTEYYDVFLQDTRINPDDATMREAVMAGQERAEAIQEEAKRILEQTENREQVKASARRVRDLVASQLTENVGMPVGQANTAAALHEAFAVVLGEKLGMDPYDAYVQAAKGLKIQSAPNIETYRAQGANIPPGSILNQITYHGSGVRGIDQLSTDYVGTGEGEIAFGWGLYFADEQAVAESYRMQIATQPSVAERVRIGANNLVEAVGTDRASNIILIRSVLEMTDNGMTTTTVEAVRRKVAQYAKKAREDGASIDTMKMYARIYRGLERYSPSTLVRVLPEDRAGAVYKVKLAPKDDEWLLWDERLKDQSDKVKAVVEKLLPYTTNVNWTSTGGEFYMALNNPEFVSPEVAGTNAGLKEVSLKLDELGVRGNKYLDQRSRNAKQLGRPLKKPTYNYVVFDGDNTKIVEYYQSQQFERVREHLGLWSAVEQAVIDMNLPGWKAKKKALPEDKKTRLFELEEQYRSSVLPGAKLSPEEKAELKALRAEAAGSVPTENGKQIWNKLKSMPGVKKEELEWLGIEDYLTAEDGARFSRDEVLGFVRNNGVKIEEVVATTDSEDVDVSITWSDPEVIDDPSEWEYRVEDLMYEFEQATSLNDLRDVLPGSEARFDNFVEDNLTAFVEQYKPAVGDEQAEKLDEFDIEQDLEGAINYVTDELGYPGFDEFKALIEADFRELANDYARDEYMADPVVQVYSPEANLEIVGNDSMGYIIKRADSGTIVSGPRDEIYSLSEAQIQAEEIAREEGMVEDEESPTVAKWEEFTMDGNFDNYRELKLILPNFTPPFSYTTHFPDDNILTYLRVSTRELPVQGELYTDLSRLDSFGDDYKKVADLVRETYNEFDNTIPPDDFIYQSRQYGWAKAAIENYLERRAKAKEELKAKFNEYFETGDAVWDAEAHEAIMSAIDKDSMMLLDHTIQKATGDSVDRMFMHEDINVRALSNYVRDYQNTLKPPPVLDMKVEIERAWQEGVDNYAVSSYILNKLGNKVLETLGYDPNQVDPRFKNYRDKLEHLEQSEGNVAYRVNSLLDQLGDLIDKTADSTEQADKLKARFAKLEDNPKKLIEEAYAFAVGQPGGDQVRNSVQVLTSYLKERDAVAETIKDIERQWELGINNVEVVEFMDDNNVFSVAHDSEATTAKSTYFIEESQSDWHQQGRKYGYYSSDMRDAETMGEIAAVAMDRAIGLFRNDMQRAYESNRFDDFLEKVGTLASIAVDAASGDMLMTHSEIMDKTRSRNEHGLIHLLKVVEAVAAKSAHQLTGWQKDARDSIDSIGARSMFMKAMINALSQFDSGKQIMEALEESINASADELAAWKKIPYAPFGKKDNWVNLAVKRALVDAVDHGFTRIAWVASTVPANTVGSYRYIELYKNQYDRRLVKAFESLTKTKATNIRIDDKTNYWVLDIPQSKIDEIESDGFALFQRKDRPNAPRGMIQFQEDAEAVMTLFTEEMDLSTFLHESGHFFLQTYINLADQSEAIKQDLDVLLDWFGVSSPLEITVEHHEQFAAGFEQYLLEGKAPSKGLQRIFDTFKAWLTKVYESIMNSYFSDVNLSDEVRRVMAGMLATDEAIEAVNEQDDMLAAFMEQQDLFSQAEAETYRQKSENAKSKSKADADSELVKRMKREASKEWKRERDQLKEQIEAELYAEPVHQARYFLMRGTFPNGELPEGMEPVKLSKDALVEMYGDGPEALWRKLPFGRYSVWTKEGGVHPDEIAIIFGFANGDEMVRAMAEVKGSVPKMAEERANEMMREKYGDPDSERAVAELAMRHAQNDEKAAALAVEMRALGRKAGRVMPTRQVITNAAKRILESVMMGDMVPNTYLRQANKFGRLAFDNAVKQNFKEAAEYKQKQLLNMEMYRLSLKMKEDAEKRVKYIQRYKNPNTRKRIATPNLEQIDNILEAYNFKRSITLKETRERKALREWIDEQLKKGLEVAIDPEIIEVAHQRSWKELTYEELVGVHEALKNIEYVGRYEKKVILENEKRTFDELIDALVETAGKNNKIKTHELGPIVTGTDKAKAFGRAYLASHVKMEFFAQQLDGDKPNGLWWNTVFRPLAEAEDAELRMSFEAMEKLNAIFEAYDPSERSRIYRDVIDTEDLLGRNIKKSELLSIALNWGNSGNREALLEGEKWTHSAVKQVLDKHMTEKDWAVVQGIWDFIDSFWPQIADLQERMAGVRPAKVEAEPFDTPFGKMRGGYYPLVYDYNRNFKAFKFEERKSVEEMLGTNYLRPATRKGHTIERKGSGGMPVKLDLDVIAQHVTNVIHDLTHREAIAFVDRVFQNEKVRETIVGVSSKELYRMIRPWLAQIASDRRPIEGWTEQVVARLRRGATAVNMGLKVTTAMVQPLGYLQSVELLGSKWSMVGLRKVYGNPVKFKAVMDEVFEKSTMMVNRTKTLDRDVRDAINNIKGNSYYDNLQRNLYTHIGFADLLVSIPTWVGGYEKARAEGMSDKDAIAYADSVVRMSQSAGGAKDLADIQRGTNYKRSFVMFYSYFSVMQNLMARRKRIAMKQGVTPRNIAETTMSFMYLVAFPAVLAEIALGHGPDDDDDETYIGWMAKLVAAYPFMAFVGVRDFVNYLASGYSYKATPILDAGDTIARSMQSVVELPDPEKEWDRNDTKNILMTTGYLFALPSRQLYTTGEHLYAVLNDEEDFSLYELLIRNVPEDEK